jgi:hypothetical protein
MAAPAPPGATIPFAANPRLGRYVSFICESVIYNAMLISGLVCALVTSAAWAASLGYEFFQIVKLAL